MNHHTRRGILYALGAYGLWGIAPLYFKWVGHIHPFDVVSNRVLWSFLLLGILIGLLGQWPRVRVAVATRKNCLFLVSTTVLIGLNWGLFIWAVSENRLLEASLGYYINPLVNVVLGFFLLSERLSKIQWLAVGFAVVGVSIEVVQVGYLPWVSLVLAFSFAAYGLLHKRIPTDSLTTLFVETLLLSPLALLYLAWLSQQGLGPAVRTSWDWLALLLAGPVTTVPLLLFSSAAKRLHLSTMGFFQYVAPSLMFLLAIFVYEEPLRQEQLLTFFFIWMALAIFSGGVIQHRWASKSTVPPTS